MKLFRFYHSRFNLCVSTLKRDMLFGRLGIGRLHCQHPRRHRIVLVNSVFEHSVEFFTLPIVNLLFVLTS
jgi:hypothetical protein